VQCPHPIRSISLATLFGRESHGFCDCRHWAAGNRVSSLTASSWSVAVGSWWLVYGWPFGHVLTLAYLTLRLTRGFTPSNTLSTLLACLFTPAVQLALFTLSQHLFPFMSCSQIRGMYASHLKVWLRYFPRGSFLIINSRDYFDDNNGTMIKVRNCIKLVNVAA
jgi:hypothetical protein